MGETKFVPVPFVRQMAAVQFWPPGCVVVVVRLVPAWAGLEKQTRLRAQARGTSEEWRRQFREQPIGISALQYDLPEYMACLVILLKIDFKARLGWGDLGTKLRRRATLPTTGQELRRGGFGSRGAVCWGPSNGHRPKDDLRALAA